MVKDQTKAIGTKYDWDALKIEFLRGKWKTAHSFRHAKGLSHGRYMCKRMNGWTTEKQKVNKKALEKATKDIVVKGSESIQKAMQRQSNLARWLQVKGVAALRDLDPKDADTARKLIVSGMKEERTALGAGKRQGGPQSLTQVNVKLPKTRFDEMIDELGYEGLLGVIAEIRKLRTGKSREAVDAKGQGKTN